MPFDIRQLEIHLSHSCNLQCDGCQHFTDYKLGGNVPFEIGSTWIQNWSQRVRPARFKLLGGEPLLNPDVDLYLIFARKCWPDTRLILTTNGLLLPKMTDRFAHAVRLSGAVVYVSKHSTEPEYLKKLERGIDWLIEKNLSFNVDSGALSGWYRGYLGHGNDARPFDDGKPRQSWEVCHAKYCMQLFDGRIWKCAPVAYWDLFSKKFPGVNKAAWQKFFDYGGVGLNADDSELAAFLWRQDEPICGLCPAEPRNYVKAIRR